MSFRVAPPTPGVFLFFLFFGLAALLLQLVFEAASLVFGIYQEANARRLLLKGGNEEVRISRFGPRSLQQMLNGSLYQKDAKGSIVVSGESLPTVGPFHIFRKLPRRDPGTSG